MTTLVQSDVDTLEQLDFEINCSIKVLPPGYVHTPVDEDAGWVHCEKRADYMAITKCCGDARSICNDHLLERQVIFCCRCGVRWHGFPACVSHFYPL